jgi:hypothetical protein
MKKAKQKEFKKGDIVRIKLTDKQFRDKLKFFMDESGEDFKVKQLFTINSIEKKGRKIIGYKLDELTHMGVLFYENELEIFKKPIKDFDKAGYRMKLFMSLEMLYQLKKENKFYGWGVNTNILKIINKINKLIKKNKTI